MPAKIQKLQDQYKDDLPEGENSGIFKGVSIFVNGYTSKVTLDLCHVKKGDIFKNLCTAKCKLRKIVPILVLKVF